MNEQKMQLLPPEPKQEIVHEDINGVTILRMIQDQLAQGVTAERVGAIKELVGLCEHMQDRADKKRGIAAFRALQSEMPAIKATKPVPNNDGSIRYKFAPFEEIMDQVQPLLDRHGFTVSFSTRFDEGRMTKSCTVRHSESGWEQVNEFTVRVGSGPPKASETQADGAASSYAKRFALCDALNIRIEKGMDDDANAFGAKISAEKAAYLRQWLKDVGGNEKAFLAFAQAATFDDIHEAKLPQLEVMLAKKQARAK
jgi:hypothetical protein